MISKLDFYKDKLESHVVQLAGMYGHETPSTYLNELLKQVESFNDYRFTCDFYINIFNLFKKHANKFWNQRHKEDILNWLKRGPVISNSFGNVWELDEKAMELASDVSYFESPKTFDEMFEYPDLINECIDVLKTVKPPIITKQNEYNLGSKSKGSIVAWIIGLKFKGIIKKSLSDEVISRCLNLKFVGLNLGKDGRTLRNTETTSYKKYYTTILSLLPDIPLSSTGKNR